MGKGLVLDASTMAVKSGTASTDLTLDANTGDKILANKVVRVLDGTADAPSVAFSDDLTTGLYSSANGRVNISSLGFAALEVIGLASTGAKYLTISNAEAGTADAVTLSAAGAADVDVAISGAGTGVVKISGNAMPTTTGTSGQVLQSDGAGNITWQDAAGGVDWGVASVINTAPQVTGSSAIALGNAAKAPVNSVALGYNVDAGLSGTGHNNNVVIGQNSSISGNYQSDVVLIGNQPRGLSGSIGIGKYASAYGVQSVAIGCFSNYQYGANNSNAVAIGSGTCKTGGNYAVAIGRAAQANGASSVVIGDSISVSSSNAIAIGSSSSKIEADGSGRLSLTGTNAQYVCPSYATASRPTGTTGGMVFDTDLGKPIWYNGTNWVDATGTTV